MLKRHFQDAKACLREIENFKEICKKRSYPDNVVLYFGTEEKVDFVSIYMEMCDGDLEQWAKGGLPECKLTALEICKQATEGIHYLHTKCNMIHRDVKPCNFLIRIDDDGAIIKVCDFGLTKILPSGDTHATTSSNSTLSYMAPEYLQKEDGNDKQWVNYWHVFQCNA
ncbi:unnamed protein product [Clavelina lepadiformis]|uniref:Protein kinase domain-containing protein n=1 Tax=Clavelina lepadiformis TaxID=159417 RepID=A0ABP0FRJ9_CLALP